MIEKSRKYLDTSGHGSALLTERSKAFDCMSLKTYGVDTNLLYFLASYTLKKRSKEQKIMVLTVILMTFLVAFHKVPYQVHI